MYFIFRVFLLYYKKGLIMIFFIFDKLKLRSRWMKGVLPIMLYFIIIF